jgi:F420-non-reducing hydrogenase small subunit
MAREGTGKVRVAWDMLAGCSGCEMALLDIGPGLLELLQTIDLVHLPLLLDNSCASQADGSTMTIPRVDVGFLSGSIRTQAHVLLAQEMRRQSERLIALGTCACFGGVTALANLHPIEDLADQASIETRMPRLTDRVYRLEEAVKVDMALPGCPPSPESLSNGLASLARGSPIELSSHSVCDDCPTVRLGKAVSPFRRPLESIDIQPEPGIGGRRCFLEQGYLCLGPVTRTGCGGMERTPRCILSNVPCRGCYGPLRLETNPLVDMIGALASIGLDARQIEDRLATFDRYAGLTGKNRPLARRPGAGA